MLTSAAARPPTSTSRIIKSLDSAKSARIFCKFSASRLLSVTGGAHTVRFLPASSHARILPAQYFPIFMFQNLLFA